MAVFYKWIRYLAYMIEILVFYIIQRIPFSLPMINAIKPILLLPTAIMIALFEGKHVGTIFGLIIGIFLDCGASGNLGFYSVTVTCMCFLVGTVAQKMIKFNLITAVLVSISFIVLFYLSHFLIMYLIHGYSDLRYTLINHYLIGTIYTFIFSPFIYFFNKAFAVNIKEQE